MNINVDDETLEAALMQVIERWNRCDICGSEDDNEHQSMPHMFERSSALSLFKEALNADGNEASE